MYIVAQVELGSYDAQVHENLETIIYNGSYSGCLYFKIDTTPLTPREAYIFFKEDLTRTGKATIFIKNQNSNTEFTAYENLLVLRPVQPVMPDIAFYISQLLNLCDNIKIYKFYTAEQLLLEAVPEVA